MAGAGAKDIEFLRIGRRFIQEEEITRKRFAAFISQDLADTQAVNPVFCSLHADDHLRHPAAGLALTDVQVQFKTGFNPAVDLGRINLELPAEVPQHRLDFAEFHPAVVR